MKKLTFSLVIILITSLSVCAQKQVVKVNALSLFVGSGSFFYERAITRSSSLQLGLFRNNINSTGSSSINGNTSTNTTECRGFGITPEYRFYLGGEALSGIFIATFLRYQNYSIEEETISFNGTRLRDRGIINSFGGGLLLGGQWSIGKRFTMDVFAGPRYNERISEAGDIDPLTNAVFRFFRVFEGFGLRAGLTFGFSF